MAHLSPEGFGMVQLDNRTGLIYGRLSGHDLL